MKTGESELFQYRDGIGNIIMVCPHKMGQMCPLHFLEHTCDNGNSEQILTNSRLSPQGTCVCY